MNVFEQYVRFDKCLKKTAEYITLKFVAVSQNILFKNNKKQFRFWLKRN